MAVGCAGGLRRATANAVGVRVVMPLVPLRSLAASSIATIITAAISTAIAIIVKAAANTIATNIIAFRRGSCAEQEMIR